MLFDFASPVSAFAIDLEGLTAPHPEYLGFLLLLDVLVDGVPAVHWEVQTGGVLDVRFLGLIDSASSFSTVELLDMVIWPNPPCPSECGLAPPHVGLDRVQYSSVPEPVTSILIALGLVGLAGWRRVRHQQLPLFQLESGSAEELP